MGVEFWKNNKELVNIFYIYIRNRINIIKFLVILYVNIWIEIIKFFIFCVLNIIKLDVGIYIFNFWVVVYSIKIFICLNE